MRYAIRASFFDFRSRLDDVTLASQHARYIEEGVLLIDQGLLMHCLSGKTVISS